MTATEAATREQASLVQSLRAAVYALPDPSADAPLLERMAREQAKLRNWRSNWRSPRQPRRPTRRRLRPQPPAPACWARTPPS